MELLREAGLPDGVINVVYGDGAEIGEVALKHRDLAGVAFTGSTGTFQHIWRTVGANISSYRNYPRVVGETGGKDFVLAHHSADIDALATACIRGAYEYQGQKCAAASRLAASGHTFATGSSTSPGRSWWGTRRRRRRTLEPWCVLQALSGRRV
jgi:1-pyrroline-5-carboxylate dehydrogenase